VTVKSALYAKYYFELRNLFKDNDQDFPLKPLEKKDAVALELNSNKYKNKYEELNIKQMALTSATMKKKEWDC